jgi:hypothetical protein
MKTVLIELSWALSWLLVGAETNKTKSGSTKNNRLPLVMYRDLCSMRIPY